MSKKYIFLNAPEEKTLETFKDESDMTQLAFWIPSHTFLWTVGRIRGRLDTRVQLLHFFNSLREMLGVMRKKEVRGRETYLGSRMAGLWTFCIWNFGSDWQASWCYICPPPWASQKDLGAVESCSPKPSVIQSSCMDYWIISNSGSWGWEGNRRFCVGGGGE